MNSSRLVFRVQPAGLGVDHLSETSATRWATDEETGCEYDTSEPILADGLHVFLNAAEAKELNEGVGYGDEVVVLAVTHHWYNGDVEGVCIDGSRARIVARIPHANFRPEEF